MYPCHTGTQDKVKVTVVTQALASVIVFSDISRNEVMTFRSRSFSAASIISLSPGKSICIPLHNVNYQANVSLENLTVLSHTECLVHTLNEFNHLNFYYVTWKLVCSNAACSQFNAFKTNLSGFRCT